MSPFDARFVPYLRAAEDRHFWFLARNAIISALISRIEPTLPPRYRVLEIGCGTGNTLQAIQAVCRRGTVIGMDLYQDGLVLARARTACPLVRGDVDRPPFSPATHFDLIAMLDVIEHIEDDARVLATVRTMLAPGAFLLLTVPAGAELWSAFDEAAGHYRRYAVEQLAETLVAAGYRLDYLSPFMVALYPFAWVRRRLGSRPQDSESAFDVARRDLQIVPILNSLMRWAVSREARPVAKGARLPFGTSLIALARPA
jgi:SAM-dependent methyltransferase